METICCSSANRSCSLGMMLIPPAGMSVGGRPGKVQRGGCGRGVARWASPSRAGACWSEPPRGLAGTARLGDALPLDGHSSRGPTPATRGRGGLVVPWLISETESQIAASQIAKQTKIRGSLLRSAISALRGAMINLCLATCVRVTQLPRCGRRRPSFRGGQAPLVPRWSQTPGRFAKLNCVDPALQFAISSEQKRSPSDPARNSSELHGPFTPNRGLLL